MTELNPDFPAEARNYSGGEVSLHVADLFFSRTNERAIIQSGNSVFQRVSGFEWSDLIGAPHKLVRHPEMPKGLFQLMWDWIKDGRPIGYYVKNREKSGKHYWVYALVKPIEGGYLSTRIKPSSDMVKKVSELYADLLRREQEENLSPADSAAALVDAIKSLGYPSYNAFQAETIAREFEQRSRMLGQSMEPMLKRFLVMSKGINEVEVETTEMTEAFKSIRTVPMNMRIIASRLENAGGPISAISVNYSQMLEEMSTWVKTFVDGDECVFARIRDAIMEGQFMAFATALEKEMIDNFEKETEPEGAGLNFNGEMSTLETNRKAMLDRTVASLVRVDAEAKRFGRSVLDMKRYVTGLSSTRMMCKIESASLSNSGTALTGIVDQLDECQNEIETRLGKIVELNSAIQSNTAMLRSMF